MTITTMENTGVELPTTPEDISVPEDSTLQKFYDGSTIFITGATGFMGKVLVEKLLRSCPGIVRIYLMVREKKGRKLEERIDDLAKSPCFDRIRLEQPTFKAKLSAICGDVGLPGLGISDADHLLLSQQVDVVFHAAATVRFDEKLKTAILLNVRGMRDLLQMCRSFNKLKAVIHVSTAYAYSPQKTIDEKFYKPPITSEMAIHMAEGLDDAVMADLEQKLIGAWPNTYAFTKALSEEACERYGQGLPLGVFRPSIVVCTRKEPMCGWIDNLYGPTGVIVGGAAGVMRIMSANLKMEANIVPCDMAINGIIASAWDVVERIQLTKSAKTPVYNYISPRVNKTTWGQFHDTYHRAYENYPMTKAIWYGFMVYPLSWWTILISRIFLHYLPAYLVDFVLLISGRKPMLVKATLKIHKFSEVIKYFATQEWVFADSNVVDLWHKLSDRDKELFDFNMRGLDWVSYMTESVPNLRLHLLKETPDTIESAKLRLRRLFVLHCCTLALVALLAAWIVYTTFSAIIRVTF